MNEQINRCLNCGTEQGLVGVTEYYCERCGAKNHSDGSCSYDATHEGIEQMRENEQFYDSGYNDREAWNRNGRGRF